MNQSLHQKSKIGQFLENRENRKNRKNLYNNFLRMFMNMYQASLGNDSSFKKQKSGKF